jgi:hypothetical protein
MAKHLLVSRVAVSHWLKLATWLKLELAVRGVPEGTSTERAMVHFTFCKKSPITVFKKLFSLSLCLLSQLLRFANCVCECGVCAPAHYREITEKMEDLGNGDQ